MSNVSIEPYCYEVVKAMCDTEFSRTKVKDAILNEPLYTAAQLAAARQQGAEEELKEWEAAMVLHNNGVLRQRIDTLEAALKVWLDKTEWVQQDAAVKELGMHRADVLKQRIAELEQKNAVLLEALKSAEPAIAVGYGLTRVKVLNAIAAAEVKP